MSDAWRKLVEAVGSKKELYQAIGVSQKTLDKVIKGERAFPKDPTIRESLDILCNLYDVANPLDGPATVRAKDLSQLQLLGEALSRGWPIAPRTIDKLRGIYPQAQLIQLAESENTPELILRAVTVLLEAT